MAGTERTLGRTLGQLALALLNATLLLVLAVLVCGLLFVSKLQNFAADTAQALGADVRQRIEERAEGLGTAVARLDTLNARLSERAAAADTATAAEIAELRSDVGTLTAEVAGLRSDLGAIRNMTASGVRATLASLLADVAAPFASDAAGIPGQ